jgi:hypothetical protein
LVVLDWEWGFHEDKLFAFVDGKSVTNDVISKEDLVFRKDFYYLRTDWSTKRKVY